MGIFKKQIVTMAALAIAGAAGLSFVWGKSGVSVTPPISDQPMSQQTDVPAAARARHVFIVVLENHDYESVIGNMRDMPYLNSLASTYASARNYYADTHPSIGNYFVLTAGKKITDKNGFSETVTDDNIVRQLVQAGKTWKEYSESLPEAGYIGDDRGRYTEHHNPLSYFSDVRGSDAERANLVPLSRLAIDLGNHALPEYAFIVPDNRHNAHNCPRYSGCQDGEKLAAADEWLSENIDPILRSAEFDAPGGGLLIITFDEAKKSSKKNGGGHVAWVIAGSGVKRGYVSDAFYQHASTLRLMVQALGLANAPGRAATAADMGEFFSTDGK